MRIKHITILIASALIAILTSCEGSRSRRMLDSVDRAVDDYNNGDSSSLIVLIVGGIILGGLWCYNQYKKNK